MDAQVETLLNFLKQFRENNTLTDEHFARQLAHGIVAGEAADPALAFTFDEHFMRVMKQTQAILADIGPATVR